MGLLSLHVICHPQSLVSLSDTLAAQVVVCSACSGHGFKFASVVGECLADLAQTGATRHDISLHRLGRFLPKSNL